MELRILGPTEIRHDGSPVSLRGAKPRQLLVLLAMRPNRSVPSEELIEELWEGDPPPSAATALRVHIGRLRQVLELDRNPSAPNGRLPAGPHGYVLRVEPDELDVQRFERLLVLAREADAHGDPGAAVPRLTEALDLWRGAALADARDLSATRAEIARLEELRIVAIEQLADVRLSLGDHSLVIDSLTAAIKEHPLRERLTESLMRALYRSGRQGDALRAYADLARRLDEDLGIAPSARLRRLEEDVLLQRSTLDFVAPRSMSHAIPQRGWSSVRFIGRRNELRRLVELYDEAREGQRRSALVVGPPGIGKTTLVEEYCERLRCHGAVPLFGYCDPDPAGDYQPVAEILRALVKRLDDSSRSALPAALRLVLPELAADESSSDVSRDANAPGAQFRLFDAIATTLERLAETPIVLVVEDIHWADRPTLALLRYLQRHPGLDHLLVIATLRDDEFIGERAELIEHLAPRANTTTLRLDGFGDYEVRALIRSAALPEAMPMIIDASGTLQGITGGNPYFLRELLRELDEEPAKSDVEGDLARTLATIAPAGVRAVVDRRLDRLTDRAREVLDAASVLGGDVSVDLLASMCRIPSAAVFHALEESLAARLLVEDFDDVERYLFPHMLTRNAVYAAITPDRRILLHRRAGEALEQSEVVTSRRCVDLARHFGEAAPLGLEDKAAEYAAQAGDDAAGRSAPGESGALVRIGGAAPCGPADDVRAIAAGCSLRVRAPPANDGRLELARAPYLAAADFARGGRDAALLADVALAADGPWTSDPEFQLTVLPGLERSTHRPRSLRPRPPGADPERDRVRPVLHRPRPRRRSRARRRRPARDNPTILAHSDRRSLSIVGSLTGPRRDRSGRWSRRTPGSSWLEGGPRALQLLIHRSLLSDLVENAMMVEFDAGLDEYERSATEFGSPRDIYWAAALRATQATWRGDLVAAEQPVAGATARQRADQASAGARTSCSGSSCDINRPGSPRRLRSPPARSGRIRRCSGRCRFVADVCAEVGQRERASTIARA